MPRLPMCELVLEIGANERDEAVGTGNAARALQGLPGVTEAHVDDHCTWAMVTYDPEVTTIAVITGCLAAHGLRPSRARPLLKDSDPCE